MIDPLDGLALIFLFALGACCGSFLNVIVYRLPEVEPEEGDSWWRFGLRQMRSLSHPPSRCPRCGVRLKIYDNVPILGWMWLRGRCRNCRLPISVRYPIVEAATALLFVGLYASFFFAGPQLGPPTPAVERSRPEVTQRTREWRSLERVEVPGPVTVQPAVSLVRVDTRARVDWPMLAIVLTLVFCLLAASMIDAEHYIIPRSLSYLPAVVGVVLHAIFGKIAGPLDVSVGPVGLGWALGGLAGWVLALVLLRVGVLRQSFADGMPELERDGGEMLPPGKVRLEMLWEVAFLALPIGLGLLGAWLALGPLAAEAASLADIRPVASAAGAVLGGLIGAGVIWLIRVAGSLAFGREAMGLGDVDLMFGVGCCIGAGPASIAVFPAALVGLAFAVVRLVRQGGREMPFGPYLAIGSVLLVLFFNPLMDYLRPGLLGLGVLLDGLGPYVGL